MSDGVTGSLGDYPLLGADVHEAMVAWMHEAGSLGLPEQWEHIESLRRLMGELCALYPDAAQYLGTLLVGAADEQTLAALAEFIHEAGDTADQSPKNDAGDSQRLPKAGRLGAMPSQGVLQAFRRAGCQISNRSGSHWGVTNPLTGDTVGIGVHRGQTLGRGVLKKLLSRLGASSDMLDS